MFCIAWKILRHTQLSRNILISKAQLRSFIHTSYAASLALTVALCPSVVLAVVTDAVSCVLPDFSDFWLMLVFSLKVDFSFSTSIDGITNSFLGKPNENVKKEKALHVS